MSEKYISKDYLHDKFLACELEFFDAHKYARAKGVDGALHLICPRWEKRAERKSEVEE